MTVFENLLKGVNIIDPELISIEDVYIVAKLYANHFIERAAKEATLKYDNIHCIGETYDIDKESILKLIKET